MPYAGTAGATSGLPGSRTAPSVTAFSARALRREAMVKLKIAYDKMDNGLTAAPTLITPTDEILARTSLELPNTARVFRVIRLTFW